MLWEGHRQGLPQYTGKNNLIEINGCCCCCCCKQMAGEKRDIIDMKCLKSENGEVLTKPHAVNEMETLYGEVT